jgi:tRNA (guanine37-N1)-methyltransferase
LQAERDRLLKIFKPSEILCDMFCGIGPLSIRAAKLGMRVLANDLNPECYEYLKINAKTNKVEHLIKPYNMDARLFIKHIVDKEDVFFNHVYMNLPVDAVEFLDVFQNIFIDKINKRWNKHNLPFIHVCGFDAGKSLEEVEKNFEDRIRKVLKDFKAGDISYIHPIKDITSEKKMYCIGFKLSEEIAFGSMIEDDKEVTAEDFEKVEKKLKTE